MSRWLGLTLLLWVGMCSVAQAGGWATIRWTDGVDSLAHPGKLVMRVQFWQHGQDETKIPIANAPLKVEAIPPGGGQAVQGDIQSGADGVTQIVTLQLDQPGTWQINLDGNWWGSNFYYLPVGVAAGSGTAGGKAWIWAVAGAAVAMLAAGGLLVRRHAARLTPPQQAPLN